MRTRPASERPGYVLLVVLMVVVVLSLAAYRFTEAMTSEYAVAARSTEAVQARAFAVSGVHYAAGMLADPTLLGSDPSDAPGSFANINVGPEEAARGGGRFSLFHVADTFNGSGAERYQIRNGVGDESAKLNINSLIQLDKTGKVLHDALMKLPNMTEEVADAIVDWVDSDDTQRTAGAESAHYLGQTPSYGAKNGPLSTLDELLFVRGVTAALLYGSDTNRNGKVDANESGDFSRGWSEYLTVYGREVDADRDGSPRIDLTDTSDLPTLSENLTAALGQEMSDYVMGALLYGTSAVPQSTVTINTSSGSGGMTLSVTMSAPSSSTSSKDAPKTVVGGPNDLRTAVQASLATDNPRAKGRIKSVLSLYNTQVTLPKPPSSPPNTPTVVVASPLNDANKLKEFLPKLLDSTTTRTSYEIAPRVNVNTAPPEVLAALPGLTQTDVDSIVAERGTLAADDPATLTGAWLVTEATIKPTVFQSLEQYITGRTMTYRVQSVGYFAQGGASVRVEAVIDTNLGHPRIVYFRDLTELGRGFELPR